MADAYLQSFAIPEPSATGLLLLAAAGGLCMRRERG